MYCVISAQLGPQAVSDVLLIFQYHLETDWPYVTVQSVMRDFNSNLILIV